MKFFRTGKDESNPIAPSQAEIYYGFRSRALGCKPEDLHLTAVPGEPYGVLMEMGMGGSVATFMALADGTMSMYMLQGQTIIGAGQHTPVREAGLALLARRSALRSRALARRGELAS